MPANSLERPVAQLQPLLNPPPPWGFVARHLVALLAAYSTGLSFQVAADEVSAAWARHRRARAARPRVLTATVTHVAPGPPEVWLVRTADAAAADAAVYAHSNYSGVVAPRAVVALDARCLVAPPAPRGAVADHVRLVRTAFRDAADEAARAPATPERKPRRGASESPVDVIKFAAKSARAQTAATPSQQFDAQVPGGAVTQVVMPTPYVFFDLDSIRPGALGLDEPPEAFSLQRVWNERTLTPRWVYAVVAQVKWEEENAVVRLHDFTDAEEADQPSVLCTLPKELGSLAELLEPGYHVLFGNLAVEPNGNSFNLACTALTTCYYSRKTCAGPSDTVDKAVMRDITNISGREGKRRRTDAVLSQASSVVSTRQVSGLASPQAQEEFVCHARVVAATKKQGDISATLTCEDGVTVTVAGPRLIQQAMRANVGDEFLFQEMKFVSKGVSTDGIEGCGWVAGCMDNLSTMTGVLFSPIVRQLEPLRVCYSKRAVTVCSSIRTAHALVRIHGAGPRTEQKKVVLSVSDCNNTVTSSLTQAIASGDTVRDMGLPGHEDKELEGKNTRWQIALRDNCFEALVWSPGEESLSEGEKIERVVDMLPRLKAKPWLVTLIVYPDKEARLPEVSACVPCQRATHLPYP